MPAIPAMPHPLPATLVFAVACSVAARSQPAPTHPSNPIPVSINVDAGHSVGPMTPIWRFFGADEPNYATMKDGKRLLAELGELRPHQVYFRAHNLLNTGDGVPALKWGSTNAYTEDTQGRPVYDWTILDRLFDTYLARGVRPYVEIGFMPEALSIHPHPYQHEWRPGSPYMDISTGWAYPPKDYAKWGDLVYQWTKHCVARYGKAEVDRWYWEVWNEPNGAAYWHGTPEDFFKLHDIAVAAVRRALPTARVGGPDVAGSGGKFMKDFLRHCVNGVNYATGQRGTPTDFLSFHAKGQPGFVDGHVRMGIASQLGGTAKGFRMIAAIPQLRHTPIVIGEDDPDGCAACVGPQLGYRRSTLYSSYEAEVLARDYQLADQYGVNLQGALTWAFEFEDQPFFAGQRVLATGGIDLPVLNVFRMFSRMGGERVATTSSNGVPLSEIIKDGVRGSPDISALAALEPGKLAILVWYYHDDDVPGPDAAVHLALDHLPLANGTLRLTHYRIDANHSNAFTIWKQLGSPAAPDKTDYDRMQKAGQLTPFADAPSSVAVHGGSASLVFLLPRQGVSLLVLKWDTK